MHGNCTVNLLEAWDNNSLKRQKYSQNDSSGRNDSESFNRTLARKFSNNAFMPLFRILSTSEIVKMQLKFHLITQWTQTRLRYLK